MASQLEHLRGVVPEVEDVDGGGRKVRMIANSGGFRVPAHEIRRIRRSCTRPSEPLPLNHFLDVNLMMMGDKQRMAMVDVRDATPADAHGIAIVDVTSWQATYRGLIADDVLASMSVTDHKRHWLDRITGAPPRSHTLVLTRHAAVLGFAATGPTRMIDDPTTGELHALYLAPDAWGHGLGTRLHTTALDRLRAGGFLRACLWVLDNNTRARRFYDRHGWHDTGHTVLDQQGSGLLIRQLG